MFKIKDLLTKKLPLTLFVLIALPIAASAAMYALNPVFFSFSFEYSGGGFAATPTGFDADVYQTVQDNLGRTVAVGQFTTYNGIPSKGIARLNPNGSLDSTFNVGTGFSASDYFFTKSIAIDSNGKILVTGKFSSYNGSSANTLVRLNTDGSMDTSFAVSDSLRGYGSSVKVDAAGKIVVGGNLSSPGLVGQWTQRDSAGQRDWSSITSSADGTKLVAADISPGYIYTSTDSGVTWTEQTNSGQRYWHSLTA